MPELELFYSNKKTGKRLKHKIIVGDWINEKLKNKEWEDYGVSDVKYYISFLPMLNKKKLNKKDAAKSLGVSYGVLRKFLSEKKVKDLLNRHIEEFSKFFSKMIISQLKKELPKIKKLSEDNVDNPEMLWWSKKTENSIRELGTFYSEKLIYEIMRKFSVAQELALSKSSFPLYTLIDIPLARLKEIISLRFKADGKMKLYLTTRMEGLREILLYSYAGLSHMMDAKKKDEEIRLSSIDVLLSTTKFAKNITSEMLEEIMKLK